MRCVRVGGVCWPSTGSTGRSACLNTKPAALSGLAWRLQAVQIFPGAESQCPEMRQGWGCKERLGRAREAFLQLHIHLGDVWMGIQGEHLRGARKVCWSETGLQLLRLGHFCRLCVCPLGVFSGSPRAPATL